MISLYSRFLPSPIHSITLLLCWLMLNGISVGHLVLGAFLAWIIPLYTQHLATEKQSKMRSLLKAIEYILIVFWDILIANFETLPLMFRRKEKLNPAMIAVPVELGGPLPKTLLASTISITPGTVSLDYSEDGKTLYVHALDTDDPDAIVSDIKDRYEARLREIFYD